MSSNPLNALAMLPVSSLDFSTQFYSSIGFVKDPRYTTAYSEGMFYASSPSLYVYLFFEPHFERLVPEGKSFAKSSSTTGSLICLEQENKEDVDKVLDGMSEHQGKKDVTPIIDRENYFYSRSLEDPDGHLWHIRWFAKSKNSA
jgi:uncharacterized protein